MNDSIYRINLDIHTVGSQVFLPVKRGDTARTILIRLTQGYKSYQIADGCSARFCGKKPDGNYLYNDCTISGGIITYNLTSQTTACEGVVECEIQLFDADEKQITSPRFSLVVDGTVYNGEEIASTPEADALKELTDKFEEMINQYDEGIIVGKGYVDNNFANALKGTASGNVVTVKDVSPLPHNVTVKALGNTEGGNVNVKVCGKNLFDISKVISTTAVVNNGDGTITVNTGSSAGISAKAPNTLRDYAPNLKVGETYFLSANSTPVEGSSYANNYIYIGETWFFNSAKKITESMLNSTVYWYTWGKSHATTTISDIQIEHGKAATEYEPYREPMTYALGSDGEVTVPSQYPSMTFIPDTEGVELSVEYNRDINKAFAELQAALISMGGNV